MNIYTPEIDIKNIGMGASARVIEQKMNPNPVANKVWIPLSTETKQM